MASKTYPRVVREKIVALARSGRSLTSIAREFEPSIQTIRKWVEQARREERLENMDIKRRGIVNDLRCCYYSYLSCLGLTDTDDQTMMIRPIISE